MDIVAQRDFKLNPDTETIERDCMHRKNIKGFGVIGLMPTLVSPPPQSIVQPQGERRFFTVMYHGLILIASRHHPEENFYEHVSK